MYSHSYADPRDAAHKPGRLGLVGLVVGLASVAAGLYAIGGPPHLPHQLPSWDMVLFTLRGTDVPIEALGYLFTTAAWALWLWLAGSLALRLFIVAAETLTHGAAWVRSLRGFSDRITLPFIRRLVDGAVVATLVINLVGRTAPSAYAAPLEGRAATFRSVSVGDMTTRDGQRVDAVAPPDQSPQVADQVVDQVEQPIVLHTVVKGDTLWAMSERYFGTGFEYARIVDANAGRQMPDGRIFTRAGVIQPGWVLRIPLPNAAVDELDGERTYIVAPDDTLQGIAARTLGDEAAWSALFEANRGARLPDGRTLTDPNLIWPGLRLCLPGTAPAAAAAAIDATPPSALPAASVAAEDEGTIRVNAPAVADATAQATSWAAPADAEAGDQERQASQDSGPAPRSPSATQDESTTTAPLPVGRAPTHPPLSPTGVRLLELVAGAGATAVGAGLVGHRYRRGGVRRRLRETTRKM